MLLVNIILYDLPLWINRIYRFIYHKFTIQRENVKRTQY